MLLLCGSFLHPSPQTQAVTVILEPQGAHECVVTRNAPDFVLLSLPLLALNERYYRCAPLPFPFSCSTGCWVLLGSRSCLDGSMLTPRDPHASAQAAVNLSH